MPLILTPVEARALGALIEKEITTPDYYPLSLNALVNACNQKSNRDPEMNLDDRAVEAALHSLGQKNLAGRGDNMDGRVTKYEHRLQEAFNFNRLETAVLCELLLRGPQTPGELRSRAERMHHFDDLNEVLSTLQRLIKHNPPLVSILPRQPGTKEQRYTHLFSGDVHPPQSEQAPLPASAVLATSAPATTDRLTHLEQEVASLKSEVVVLKSEIATLKQQLANFQKQFD